MNFPDEVDFFDEENTKNVLNQSIHMLNEMLGKNSNNLTQNSVSSDNDELIPTLELPSLLSQLPDQPPPEQASYLNSQVLEEGAINRMLQTLKDGTATNPQLQMSFGNLYSMINAKNYYQSAQKQFGSKLLQTENMFGQVTIDLNQRHSKVNSKNFIWLESLGKGAFGKVQRAFDKTDRKQYAVKQVSSDSFGSLKKFKLVCISEVVNNCIIVDQQDPSLLKMYAIELDEKNGQKKLNIIMEVGECTLDQLASFRAEVGFSWSEKDLCIILKGIYDQIKKLRALNFYHRDIKPANILFSYDEKIKLFDYGCATKLASDGTTAKNVAGTPFYMAPELIHIIEKVSKKGSGNTDKISDNSNFSNSNNQSSPSQKDMGQGEGDPINLYAADLYSLGVTILTLVAPNLKRSKIQDYLENVIQDEYPNLYKIVRVLLSTDSKEREKAGFLIDDLSNDTFKFGEEEKIKFKKYQYENLLQTEDNEAFIYNNTLDISIKDHAIEILSVKIQKESQNPKKNTELRIALIKCLSDKDALPQALSEANKLLKDDFINQQTNESKRLKSEVCYILGTIYIRMAYPKEALKNLRISVDILNELKLRNHDLYLTLQLDGVVNRMLGSFADANKSWAESLEMQSLSTEPETFNVQEASYSYISIIDYDKKKLPALYQNYQQSLKQKIQRYGENHYIVAKSYNQMGAIAHQLGQIQKAEEYFQKALEVAESYFGKDSLQMSQYYFEQGYYFTDTENPKRGYKLLERVYEIVENNPSVMHIKISTFFSMGANLLQRGVYKQARKTVGEFRQIVVGVFGRFSPMITLSALQLAFIEFCQCNYDAALELISDVFVAVKPFEERYSKAIEAHYLRGLIYGYQGKYEEAKKEMMESEKASLKFKDDLLCMECFKYEGQSFSYYYDGKYQEAIEAAQKALEKRDEWIKRGFNFAEFNVANSQPELQLALIYRTGLKDLEKALYWSEKGIEFCGKFDQQEHYFCGISQLRIAQIKFELGKDTKENLKTLLEKAIQILDLSIDENHFIMKDALDLKEKLNK